MASPAIAVSPLALLVDRDEDTRMMYAEFLRIHRWRTEEAADGAEALAKAITAHPNVIVTETRLPGINGFDLCQILRRDTETGRIPIVVVTGDAFAGDVERLRSAGVDAVLVKPCLPDRLLAELERLSESNESRKEVEALAYVNSHRPGRGDIAVAMAKVKHKRPFSKVHNRHDTTNPPTPAPPLVCPVCDRPLNYLRSHVGGVSARHSEQWDRYQCSYGCGTFEYRQRTRKLRAV